jgi:hypothetical protein
VFHPWLVFLMNRRISAMNTPLRIAVLIACLLGLPLANVVFAGEAPAKGPAIRTLTDKSDRPYAFEAVGLSPKLLFQSAKLEDAQDRFSQMFSVYVVDKTIDADLPAMAGSYSVEGSSLRFTPRFSLRPGTHYRAVLYVEPRPADSKLVAATRGVGKIVTSDLTIPEAALGKPNVVTQIYPSADVLPENQLRFYIYFSGPMARGEAYQHVRLLAADGNVVAFPFIEIGEELWDAGARRLTIFVEPGRIKKGLKPRDDLGPVLEDGLYYTLHIDRTWKDASGQPLQADFNKRFRAGPAVDGAIDPAEWKIKPPASGSRDVLTIAVPRPLDHALLLRTILVVDSENKRVAGNVSVGDNERRWEFLPNSLWTTGKYQLVVDTTLEDLAGNRIGQPFEVEQIGAAEKNARPDTVRIPFVVAPARSD